MRRRHLVLVIAFLASCAGEPESIISSSTTAVGSTSSSTSTISPADVVEWPSYLVFGWHGVDRVSVTGRGTQPVVEHLMSEPVWWATTDGADGIVFLSVTAEPGYGWLPAGADSPVRVDLGDEEWAGVEIAGLIDGRPSVVVTRSWDGLVWCEPEDLLEEVLIRDLETGDERFVMCHYLDPDVGEGLGSYGGGLFTVVPLVQVGAVETSGPLRFLDLAGEEVTVEHNPFPESCAPCWLDASLSPDGSMLAYSYWPTSFWGIEDAESDFQRARADWWESAQHVPTQLVVLDLRTGEEVWRSETVAEASLEGFDGRFVTVTVGSGRRIHDILTGERVSIPPARTEPAAFWTAVLASLDTATHDYGDARVVAVDLASTYEVDTGVLWSDGWLTLEDGYWAVIAGRYDSREAAAGLCSGLGLHSGDCYPKYVATADTIDPEIGRWLIQLRADGLGIVDFGDPVEEAVAVLTAVLGPPDWNYDSEGTSVADRIVAWETLGLQFYPLPEGPPGPVLIYYFTGSPEFATVEGIRVGSNAAELQDAYPDLRTGDGCEPDPAIPIVRVDRSSEESLFFYLDGDIADPQTRVVGVRGGYDVPSC